MVETLWFTGEWLLQAAAFLAILYLLLAVLYTLYRLAQQWRRRHDRQHRSTFPYAGIFVFSAMVSAGSCLPAIFMISEEGGGPSDILVILSIVPALIAGWSFRGYVRQKMPPAAAAIERDPRPPVLYLRSFDQENLLFVVRKDQAKFNDPFLYADDIRMPEGFKSLRSFYHAIHTLPGVFGWHSAIVQNTTFEKYFRSAVTRRIGPFIALGNPIDTLPAEGAFRDYQVDERWREIFHERSARCACILVQLGSSNNLQYELVSIVARGMRHKLFILTRPQPFMFDLMAPVRRYILREKPADWPTFAGILRANGYQVPEEEPGPGAILTFEPDGRPLILKRGAFEPEEYIDAVYERLRQLNLIREDETPADAADKTRLNQVVP